jgi:chromosome segregation ATPase
LHKEQQRSTLKDCCFIPQARRILEEELRDERQSRSAAEEARGVAEAERSRLQRARDDLAAHLRVSQQKAADAEEEQCKTEEEVVALRRELAAAQQRMQEGTQDHSTDTASGIGGLAGGFNPTSQGTLDLGALQAALEAERGKTVALMAQANEAAAQAASARGDAEAAKKQLALIQGELQQQQVKAGSLTAEVSALQAQLAVNSSSSSSSAKQEEAQKAAGAVSSADSAKQRTGEVVELWQQLQQLQAAHARLQEDNRQLQQHMKRAENQVQQLQQNNRQLAAAASSAGRNKQAAAADGAGVAVEELEGEIGALQDQVELLMGKVRLWTR